MATFSNQEYADIVFIYGRADGNGSLARQMYQECYPNRRIPNVRVFYNTLRRVALDGFYHVDSVRLRNQDDSDEEEAPSSSKKKSKTEVNQLKKRLKNIMKKVIDYSDESSRVLSEPFMKLPSRRELPDYYEVIKKPLDIKKIMNRIEDSKYNDISDLERDFFTLCANAQTYNEEQSLIYEDSVRLRNVFIEVRRSYESGQNSDDSDDNDKDDDDSDGESNRSVKMKIKLKGKSKSTPSRKRKQRKYISDDEDYEED